MLQKYYFWQTMKHLPNLLTLCNLLCGCIATAYVLTAQPYTSLSVGGGLPTWNWIYGAEQIYLGALFIVAAGVFDMFDGLAARALGVQSAIGKDLDSLADVVSFGVAPSAILFKFLWDAGMSEKNAMDVSMLTMAPAFLLACFAALRLARYNVTTTEGPKGYFNGMPTPAAGLFVATLPLLAWYNPFGISAQLQKTWVLYAITGVLCWLMVSNIRFVKLMPVRWTLAAAWRQLALVVVSAALIPVLGILVAPAAFILYILLSLVPGLGKEAAVSK